MCLFVAMLPNLTRLAVGTRSDEGHDVYTGREHRRSGRPETENDIVITFTKQVVDKQDLTSTCLMPYTVQSVKGERLVVSEQLDEAMSFNNLEVRTRLPIRTFVTHVDDILTDLRDNRDVVPADELNDSDFLKKMRKLEIGDQRLPGVLNDKEPTSYLVKYMWGKMKSVMFENASKENLLSIFDTTWDTPTTNKNVLERVKHFVVGTSSLLPKADQLLAKIENSISYILNQGWSLRDMNLGNVVFYLKSSDDAGKPRPPRDEYEGNDDEYVSAYIDVKMIDWKYAIPPEKTRQRPASIDAISNGAGYNAWDWKYGTMPLGNTMSMKSNMRAWMPYVLGQDQVSAAIQRLDAQVSALRVDLS